MENSKTSVQNGDRNCKSGRICAYRQNSIDTYIIKTRIPFRPNSDIFTSTNCTPELELLLYFEGFGLYLHFTTSTLNDYFVTCEF